MTKAQSAAEPSMEDILASIRKMISEERLGPRPIPDQMARTPFAEAAPAKHTARSDAAPAASPAKPAPGLAGRDVLPEKRSAPATEQQSEPSFSSLSDALKAATAPSEQHRTLDEKIADMLDKGPATGHPMAPTDPLAVFAAGKTARAVPVQPEPGSTVGPPGARVPGRGSDPASPASTKGGDAGPARDAGLRAPERSFNGAMPSPRRDAKSSDAGTVVPLGGEAPTARRDALSPRPGAAAPAAGKAGEPAKADANKPEAKTVVSIPTRTPAASGMGQAASAPKGPMMNGATVAPFGPRPLPGTARSAPDAAGEEKRSPSDEPAGSSGPSLEDIAKATRPDSAARSDDAMGSAPAKGEAQRTTPGKTSASVFPATAKGPGSPESGLRAAIEKAAAAQAATADPANPTRGGGPSEALVDAVVDLVHSEPSSLSVFTSGSAFIHGVGANDAESDKPKEARKLDRAAAELLRPMLRQWLADNMPRIVEEALRSELDSSQSHDRGPDES